MNIRITPSAGQNALWIRGHSANNTFTNVSYTAAENINTTGNITRGWYIDAYVNDTAGTPISGAQVLMINSTGNVSIGTTGSDGYIRLYPAMAYISNSTKLKFYPYWFSVVGRSNTTNNSVNWDVGGDGNYVDGQKGKVAITVSYVAPPDTTPPVVNVSHYPSGTIYAGSYVNMTATANDSGTGNSGISEIKIYVDGQLNRTCSSSPCTTQDYAYSVGTHTYYATANDSSANQNQGRDPSAGTKSFEVLAIPAEICTDMADNDFDTYVDCADSDCFSSPSCQQQPGSQSNSTPGFEAGILAALSASFAAFAIYRKKT